MGEHPPGEDRKSFLARISARLGRDSRDGPASPPAFDCSIARLVSPSADLVEIFAAAATGVGMRVHRTTVSAADGLVVRLLDELGARRIAVAEVPLLDGVARLLADREAAAGLERVAWRAGPGVEPLYDCDAGVTDVRAAVAETGSLVCESGPGRGRGLSLVPPAHVAVVRRSDVIADLMDLWPGRSERVEKDAGGMPAPQMPRALPSSIALITGPSKTADIEGILITGVHGPREVHIVLIEDR